MTRPVEGSQWTPNQLVQAFVPFHELKMPSEYVSVRADLKARSAAVSDAGDEVMAEETVVVMRMNVVSNNGEEAIFEVKRVCFVCVHEVLRGMGFM